MSPKQAYFLKFAPEAIGKKEGNRLFIGGEEYTG